MLRLRAAAAGDSRSETAGWGRAPSRWSFHTASNELGAHRVWLDVMPANARASRVYERLGFREEGVLRAAIRMPDGRHETVVLMALLAAEWRR